MVSPPVIALKTLVPAKCSLGRSGQMLASLPYRREAANLSASNLCSDRPEVFSFPRNATCSRSHTDLPLPPGPISSMDFWIDVSGRISQAGISQASEVASGGNVSLTNASMAGHVAAGSYTTGNWIGDK